MCINIHITPAAIACSKQKIVNYQMPVQNFFS